MRHKLREKMPKSRLGRTILGIGLIIGGFLGALPILGFWMAPLGLVVLSYDSPRIRRWRRKQEVRIGRWWAARQARKEEKGQ